MPIIKLVNMTKRFKEDEPIANLMNCAEKQLKEIFYSGVYEFWRTLNELVRKHEHSKLTLNRRIWVKARSSSTISLRWKVTK